MKRPTKEMVEQMKKNRVVYDLLTQDEYACLVFVGPFNILMFAAASAYKWIPHTGLFKPYGTYRIKPDYQLPHKEPEYVICAHAKMCQVSPNVCRHKEKHFPANICSGSYCPEKSLVVSCIPYVDPVKPKVVPYTFESIPRDRGPFVRVVACDVITDYVISEISKQGLIVNGTYFTYVSAMNILTWPDDGSPFGVKVSG